MHNIHLTLKRTSNALKTFSPSNGEVNDLLKRSFCVFARPKSHFSDTCEYIWKDRERAFDPVASHTCVCNTDTLHKEGRLLIRLEEQAL